jgi:hypothetical protein
MTVRELIEMLEDFNENDEVMVSHIAHDYWRTPVAGRIDSVEDAVVDHSSYHNCFKVVEEEEAEVENATAKHVVIIKSDRLY